MYGIRAAVQFFTRTVGQSEGSATSHGRVLFFLLGIPLDDVSQPPGVLVELPLQLSFFIDDELRGREENTVALALVAIIYVDFTGSQVETLRLAVQ